MKVIIITEINGQTLELALAYLKRENEVKILLLSDAIYLINNIEEETNEVFYTLKQDLENRIQNIPDWVTPLDYNDFIDMIMQDNVTIINL